MDLTPHAAIEFMMTVFVFLVIASIILIITIFIIDITQTKDAIRKNYPVLGRFRTLFSTLGEFLRQYFFAMDREEMPFNRAERDWIHHAAKNDDNTVAFGSTKSLTPSGTTIFANCPFPTLEKDAARTKPMTIGPHCKHPYDAQSFFNISAMSYGSLSSPAIRALSAGAKVAGCWINTGEGGLSPQHLEGGADIIMQIGTAKYGLRDKDGIMCDKKIKEVSAHKQVKMFEIKLSQGAKPGKGGILPGSKVTKNIANIRGIPVGQDSISPNRHIEINSVDDLLDFIHRVRITSGKPTGFKSVLGGYQWIEEMCQKIHERGIESAPDFITLDSGDGGTGAAPMPLIDNVGLQIKESLPMLSDILHKYGLRDRIKIVASGKLVTPAEVAWAICTGADFINSGRGFMFSLGCIQAMKCNKNTCPTGITTHNKRLQKGLNPKDKATKVANYCLNLVHDVEVIAHSCGVNEPRELRRKHIRIVQSNGNSIPMDELYPRPDILEKYNGNKPS